MDYVLWGGFFLLGGVIGSSCYSQFSQQCGGHKHKWTPWSRVFDVDKNELTQVQERVCAGCGLREEIVPPPPKPPAPPGKCPPHRWGKWTPQKIVVGPASNRKSVGGQARECMECGVEVIREVTDSL